MKKWRYQDLEYKAFDIINYTLLILLSVLFLYPFIYCLILSFNDGFDALSGGIYFWPRVFTLDNYRKAIEDPTMLTAIGNTVSRTIIGIITSLFFTGMYSYGVTRKGIMFKKFYMLMGIITMYFGGGLIPTFLVMRSLGLVNNYLVYILPNLFSMFNAMIMIANFKAIPQELEESARIDGANDFTIFLRIFIPVSKPVLACLALYIGVMHWNSWFDTMIYANDKSLQTLSHLLVSMINNQQYLESVKTASTARGSVMQVGATSTSVMMATMVITAFPIIVLYPFLQKYFIKGIMIGSVKG